MASIAGDPKKVDSARLIVGFSASPRSMGGALVLGGRPLELRATRGLGRAPKPIALGRAREWICSIVGLPSVALVVIAEPCTALRDHENPALDLIRDVAATAGVPVLEVTRPEVSKALGLARATNLAIYRHLATHDEVVGRHARSRERGPRSDAERYWENAAVAAAVAMTAFSEMTDSLE